MLRQQTVFLAPSASTHAAPSGIVGERDRGATIRCATYDTQTAFQEVNGSTRKFISRIDKYSPATVWRNCCRADENEDD